TGNDRRKWAEDASVQPRASAGSLCHPISAAALDQGGLLREVRVLEEVVQAEYRAESLVGEVEEAQHDERVRAQVDQVLLVIELSSTQHLVPQLPYDRPRIGRGAIPVFRPRHVLFPRWHGFLRGGHEQHT